MFKLLALDWRSLQSAEMLKQQFMLVEISAEGLSTLRQNRMLPI